MIMNKSSFNEYKQDMEVWMAHMPYIMHQWWWDGYLHYEYLSSSPLLNVELANITLHPWDRVFLSIRWGSYISKEIRPISS